MKLLIVDSQPMIRNGLKAMLECSEENFEVFESGNIIEAISIIRKENPDLVLVDIELGGKSGLDLIKEGKRILRNCKYIILAEYISEMEFLQAEEYGVDGYILKEAYGDEILYAVKCILRGKKYYDSGIISHSRNNKAIKLFNQLTEREKEIVVELAKGLSNKEIGQNLLISESTVKKHVSNILTKLNLSHRCQVIHFIYAANIIRN
ncbi:DNA-binding response regulator [Clostridium polyendosporum]|uniref:Stage 0 sporulation protein A homolog n=1 Tax=Clostridium polyendosporum TaxID=69208 RepID=A0A919RY76_9CLOT|nr:response regulator transcription factor [Clostridium polyendosporum]GIM28715.1 DNA-binding response regulator [Clostridium polyendosporum]